MRASSRPRSGRCTATSRAKRRPTCTSRSAAPSPSTSATPAELLDAIPAEALASFAGVGHHLDLAALMPGEARARPRLRLRNRRVLRGRARGRVRPRRRRRLHPRAARQGERGCATREGFAQATSSRRASRSCRSTTELRRRHLERRHQPLACQGPRVRRGRARAAPGRPACARGHRQRPPAQGAHAAQRRAVGRMHRRRDPARQLRRGHRGRRASRSGACAATTTASSPSARSTPAPPTRCRASRWSPSRRLTRGSSDEHLVDEHDVRREWAHRCPRKAAVVVWMGRAA